MQAGNGARAAVRTAADTVWPAIQRLEQALGTYTIAHRRAIHPRGRFRRAELLAALDELEGELARLRAAIAEARNVLSAPRGPDA